MFPGDPELEHAAKSAALRQTPMRLHARPGSSLLLTSTDQALEVRDKTWLSATRPKRSTPCPKIFAGCPIPLGLLRLGVRLCAAADACA
jgi:hypothetical protein